MLACSVFPPLSLAPFFSRHPASLLIKSVVLRSAVDFSSLVPFFRPHGRPLLSCQVLSFFPLARFSHGSNLRRAVSVFRSLFPPGVFSTLLDLFARSAVPWGGNTYVWRGRPSPSVFCGIYVFVLPPQATRHFASTPSNLSAR